MIRTQQRNGVFVAIVGLACFGVLSPALAHNPGDPTAPPVVQTGAQGPTGEQGPANPTGIDEPNGPNNQAGVDEANGTNNSAGAQGPAQD
jgi:hypothetical protein